MQDTPGPGREKPATYADIEALPSNMVGEILFGRLYAHPRPAPRHSLAASELSYEIVGPFGRGRGGPGGWKFHPEPELHLGAHIVVPDLAGWRAERLPRLPKTPYFETVPDWIAEVLSPSTQRTDRTDKLAIYAEFRIGYAWYLDPTARTLEVLELTNGKWQISATFKDDDEVTAPPFEEHTFNLSVLWEPDDQEAPL